MVSKKSKKIELSVEEQKKIALKSELSNKDFEKVYGSHYERIYKFILHRSNSHEDAEDLTSLVFEKVFKKLKDFKWQGITITSWIYRIARNAIIDYYRKGSDRKQDSSIEQIGDFLESSDEKIETTLIEHEEQIHLYNAIRELKEEDQFLIYYKFFEELSNKEIAKITGISETNIGTKLHRLRKKLAGIINMKSKFGE